MPMPRESHEALLNELINPDIEHSRRTEILQELRTDYGTVVTDDENQKTSIEKLKADNTDLVVSNSKLFRQIGLTNDPKAKEKEDEKTFSETVTLESLEK